jgi:hypothetical protein
MPEQLIFPAFTTMLETVMLNMALWSGIPFGFDDLG